MLGFDFRIQNFQLGAGLGKKSDCILVIFDSSEFEAVTLGS
jgi:hypothetical protein